MEFLSQNNSDIIVRAYVKHMLKEPCLQTKNILCMIGMKQDKHHKFMSDDLYRGNHITNTSIMSRLDEEFTFSGKDKLYLMINEMLEYGYSMEEIAKALDCDIQKMYKIYEEFNSVLNNYKSIIESMKVLQKMSFETNEYGKIHQFRG